MKLNLVWGTWVLSCTLLVAVLSICQLTGDTRFWHKIWWMYEVLHVFNFYNLKKPFQSPPRLMIVNQTTQPINKRKRTTDISIQMVVKISLSKTCKSDLKKIENWQNRVHLTTIETTNFATSRTISNAKWCEQSNSLLKTNNLIETLLIMRK